MYSHPNLKYWSDGSSSDQIPVDHPSYGKLRREQLLAAYAARRENHVDLFNREYQCRPRQEPDLADLIAAHSIHIAPYDAIVYARIDKREVGVKYSATGGDKAKAVRLAVREVLRLVGVTT